MHRKSNPELIPLQHDDCFLPTPADLQIFPKVLEAVARFQSAPSDGQMREQLRRLAMEAIFNSDGKIFEE